MSKTWGKRRFVRPKGNRTGMYGRDKTLVKPEYVKTDAVGMQELGMRRIKVEIIPYEECERIYNEQMAIV